MGISIEGDVQLLAHLQTIGRKAPRNAARSLQQAAIRIRDIARRMAPRDLGNLEDAIKVDGVDGSGERGEDGRFGRKEFVVYVDEEHPAEGRKAGTLVGEYAVFMHEGNYGLGWRSLEKQFSEPEYEVGAHFLERAVDEVAKDLIPDMQRAVFSIF